MARLAVIVLFILIYSNVPANSRTLEPLAPAAIKAVINEYYADTVHEVEVINFGMSNGQSEKTIETLLKLGSSTISMKITKHAREHPQTREYELKLPSILLFDSPEHFNMMQKRIVFQSGQVVNNPHIVYIYNATFEDIQVVSDKNFTIDRTIFLVNENQNSMELATVFMYTADACELNQFKVINRFERQQNRWESTNFFVEKYNNFYGCLLASQDKVFRGILNFTNKAVNHDKMELDVWFEFFLIPLEFLETSTYVTIIEPLRIYIPPGELYGDYEKMILPFNTSAWIGITVMILLTASAIVAVKLFLPTNQELYFGRNVRSPLINFISIMINGSQHGLITENAPRILLMTFVFCSLILR
jgi:hypothetical protein